jgi:hypothetical protein
LSAPRLSGLRDSSCDADFPFLIRANFLFADHAPAATLRHLPKMHCTGSAGE